MESKRINEAFKKWREKKFPDVQNEYYIKYMKEAWKQSRIDTLDEFKKFQNDIEDVTSNNFAELVMIPHRIREWIDTELEELKNGNATPGNKSNGKKKDNPKVGFMKSMEKAKQDLLDLTGDDREYYALLDGYGYQKSNKVETKQEMAKVYRAMESAINKAAV